jgi:hypothetical protein
MLRKRDRLTIDRAQQGGDRAGDRSRGGACENWGDAPLEGPRFAGAGIEHDVPLAT